MSVPILASLLFIFLIIVNAHLPLIVNGQTTYSYQLNANLVFSSWSVTYNAVLRTTIESSADGSYLVNAVEGTRTYTIGGTSITSTLSLSPPGTLGENDNLVYPYETVVLDFYGITFGISPDAPVDGTGSVYSQINFFYDLDGPYAEEALPFDHEESLSATVTLTSVVPTCIAPSNCNNWVATTSPSSFCNFYSQCLQCQFPCQDTDYPLGFGAYFCNVFYNTIPSDNSNLGIWSSDVRSCLIQKLQPTIGQSQHSCSYILNYAFNSHPQCYLNPDPNNLAVTVCPPYLSPTNLSKLVYLLFHGNIFPRYTQPFLDQLLAVIWGCCIQRLGEIACWAARISIKLGLHIPVAADKSYIRSLLSSTVTADVAVANVIPSLINWNPNLFFTFDTTSITDTSASSNTFLVDLFLFDSNISISNNPTLPYAMPINGTKEISTALTLITNGLTNNPNLIPGYQINKVTVCVPSSGSTSCTATNGEDRRFQLNLSILGLCSCLLVILIYLI